LETGRLPPESVAAAFREETGLIVLPVRLAGLYFRSGNPDSLFFTFRCIMRGGNLDVPEGQPEAGFFDGRPLPRPMRLMHEQQVSQALHHPGGRPHWEAQALPFGRRLQSWLGRLGGNISEQTTISWRANVTVITRSASGQVLWVRRPGESVWQLPNAERHIHEAPWETARRALRNTLGGEHPPGALPGVYVGESERVITFLFAAEGSSNKRSNALETAYFTPGEEPDHCRREHVAQVAEALNPGEATRFRFQ
jgi:hypothetical protein